MNTSKLTCETASEVCSAPLENERGMVLIIVLVMLALLTILGATVLTSSTTEIRLAGNIRNQQQAFYIAQGALEHVPVATTVIGAMGNINDSWEGTIAFNGPPNNPTIVVTTVNLSTLPTTGTPNTSKVRVEYSASTTPPRGSGASADLFTANYYEMSVIGMGPNNSEVEINSEVYRLQAKETAY
jgi:Tfp pilus assembly protein PilX